MTDVILLAEVFQKHREITLEEFGIDPLHYFSAPARFKNILKKIELYYSY